MILTVEVKPGASATEVVSWRDAGTVIVRIAAPATEGRANRALIDFFAKQLRVPKTHIEIKRGQGSRVKHVALPEGTSLEPLTKSFK